MRQIDTCAQMNRWRRVAVAEKLLLSLGAIGISLSVGGQGGQAVVLICMVLVTLFGAGIPWRTLLRAAAAPAGFITVGALAQTVSISAPNGLPVFQIVAADHLTAAAFVALRASACISALLFLVLTTPVASILQLLQRLGVNADLTDLAQLMLRFIWLTLDCLENGQRSLASRLGFVNRRRMLASSGMLGAALLPRVLSRAKRVDLGLAARGYDGRLQFLSVETRTSWKRLMLVAAFVAILAVLAGWV